ncbi:sigma-70 family RNA polymerase sigma factor [Methylomonas albis]|uniref:Sigma-70 family RNA polymerase sigma factor n=1 Tax=Methylomonas albis TaxID=1854563 RepID=A0ABR9D5Y9_9GAMM|nr:sigma-70 family RNA polymerase sigma factor [Methylomonas albis]MBD9358547.1 sigma-70 family RNA polymerase sigma factor [Methylomonas albis]
MTSKGLTDNYIISQLYSDHHDWLLHWIERKVSCRLQAEDHAHDTFVRVIASKQAPNLKAPRAFLTTIANGLLINHWRRSDIEQAYLERIAAFPEEFVLSPEENAIILEVLREIDELLNQLPAKVRQAFFLAHFEDLTDAEIAQQMGVSDRMVRKYVAQAMLQCLSADL